MRNLPKVGSRIHIATEEELDLLTKDLIWIGLGNYRPNDGSDVRYEVFMDTRNGGWNLSAYSRRRAVARRKKYGF